MQTLQTTSLRVSENQLLFSTSRPCRRKNAGWRRITLRCWWTIFIPCGARRAADWPVRQPAAGLLAQRGLNWDALQQALETLRAARPTAVNLMNNLDRMKQALAREDYPQALEAEALRLVEEDKQLCDRIAEAGSALVKPGSRLLTHCNTGGPATAG